MAVTIEVERLGNLNSFSAALEGLNGRETLKLGDQNGVQGDGELSHFSANIFRSADLKQQNNNIRTALLANLGRTFGLNTGIHSLMDEYEDGRVVFRRGFMGRLREILGDKVLKSADFAINDEGSVASGKPLTVRRVQAILNATKALTLPEKRLEKATTDITNRIIAMQNEKDKSAVANPMKEMLRAHYGSTPPAIRATVSRKLKASKYFMDIIGVEKVSDAFGTNLKKAIDRCYSNQFQDRLVEDANLGFDWEPFRDGTDPDRYAVVTINGKSFAKGTLDYDTLEYRAADFEIRSKNTWANGYHPGKTTLSCERFFTVLKSMIPNTSILKCITSQLGLQGVGPTFCEAAKAHKADAKKGREEQEAIVLDPGCGHNFANAYEESLEAGLLCLNMGSDANKTGSVAITIDKGKVVLKQTFMIGLDLAMLDNSPVNTIGNKYGTGVEVPLYRATSTLTIPLNQDPPYGTMPRFETALKLENYIPA